MTVFASGDGLPAVTELPVNPGHVDVLPARLRHAILRSELKPGEEVRQERVARELNVSRTPLREALRMLEREGLVRSSANGSYRVSEFSLADMEQIYLARLPPEALAIRLTVPQLSTRELAELEGFRAQMDTFAKAKDYERWEVPHRAFHATLISESGSRVRRLIGELSDHAERYRRFRTLEGPRAWSKGFRDHRSVLDACIAGDAEAAARRLARHPFHTADDVIRLIDSAHEPSALQLALKMVETSLAPR